MTVAGCVLFSVLATLTVFSTAQAAGIRSRRSGTTLAALTGDGGGSEAFAVGAAFVGLFVFVVFIALLASEFSSGTLRAVLLRDPHRMRVIVGKLGGVAGWAVFGATLAVIFRSVPLALGVGFAWAGPFENIAVESWEAGYRFFPGQVLASRIQGGTAELGIGRAVLTAALYAGAAGATALVLLARRDITA